MNRFILIFLLFMISVSSVNAGKESSFIQREYALILTDTGYFPDRLVAIVGEKVRFFVTSTTKNKGCFVVENHNLFLAANNGDMSEGEITFNRAGRFKFYCPANQFIGYINVLEKKSQEKSNNNRREVASEVETDEEESVEKTPAYWVPRNY